MGTSGGTGGTHGRDEAAGWVVVSSMTDFCRRVMPTHLDVNLCFPRFCPGEEGAREMSGIRMVRRRVAL
jgi:hypothetical protein